MSNEFWILLIGGAAFYLILFLIDRRWGRRLLLKDFNEREKLMAQAVIKSEQAYQRMEVTVDLLQGQLKERDEEVASMRINSAANKTQIAELQSEVHRLQGVVTDLTRQLQAKNVIAEVPPPPIKAFLVAPRSDLPLVDAEAQDILRSGLVITPIFSPVTQLVLTRELRSGDQEGIFIAGHMDDKGNIPLDKGELLSMSALTALVRGRFKWVFLNSCGSVIAAQALQNETRADIICTIIDVEDADAYRTGSLFATWLAKLGDPRDAYDQSKPGQNRIYLYVSGARNRQLTKGER